MPHRILKPMVRSGYLKAGPGRLICEFNGENYLADLGNGGELFFDGLRFMNPQSCFAYICWQNSDPSTNLEIETDGFSEFSHDGTRLNEIRDTFEKEHPGELEMHDREAETDNGDFTHRRDGVRRSTRLKRRTTNMDPDAAAALAELEEEIQRMGPARGGRAKHKAPVKRMDLVRNDEESQNMLLDVLTEADETWLFCSNCHKWRRSRADPNIPSPWFCELNPDKKYASCKIPQELPSYAVDRLCNEESDHFYAITSGRPALDQCTEEDFEKDLVGFWTFLGEHNRADMIRLQRIQCNNSNMDLFGLYCEVVKWGGMMLNESYDGAGRYTGAINFSGQIFPNLKNYTPGHRATSIGNQLLVNYRKYLYDYERIWHEQDIVLFAKWNPVSPPIKRHTRSKRDLGINLDVPLSFNSNPSLQVMVLRKICENGLQDKALKPQGTNLLMLAEVLIGLDPAGQKNARVKRKLLQSDSTDEPMMNEETLNSAQHDFKAGELILARDAMYEERYWPVLIARYNDLPIHIRNGKVTPEAKDISFPYSIKELTSCKSDYIPVMVPGTSIFGWVPSIFCKPFDKNLTMQEYKESLKPPEEISDIIFRRCLKESMEYLQHTNKEQRAFALVQRQSITHVRKKLLGLEADIPTMFLRKECFPTRDIWRERVELAQTPSHMSFEVQSLSNQIDAKCFKKQAHRLVLENIVKILDHKKQEVTVFSLDRAIQLLEDAMDWPKIQKLVLAKTVPQKAEPEPSETPNDESRDVEMSQTEKVVVKVIPSGSKRKADDAEINRTS